MNKTISQKLGIKSGMRTFLVNQPDNFSDVASLPAIDLKSRLSGEFDYIHLFVTTQKKFHATFERLKKHLKATGVFWVSWPKSGQKGTDLNMKKLNKMGYDYGLVESKAISIDSTWSAMKFTHPKEGKKYKYELGQK